ncbi:MAG: diguanylate cyclase [Thiomicrospira sp.]
MNQIQGHQVQIQTSIGLAQLKDQTSLADLSIQADQALYQDKKQNQPPKTL